METPREESDQLPEEGPREQVHEDAAGSARDESGDNPGGRGEEDSDADEATGNPANAG